MTPTEFARLCVLMGYCSRKYALEYAGKRQELTDDDFILISRKRERQLDLDHQHDPPTTKRYIGSTQSYDKYLDPKPKTPWTHKYPARADLLQEEDTE